MKKRQGFVSNSSSSSFFVFAKVDDSDHFKEAVQMLHDENIRQIEWCKEDKEDDNLMIVEGIEVLKHVYEHIIEGKEEKLRNGYKLYYEVYNTEDCDFSPDRWYAILQNHFNMDFEYEDSGY